MKKRLLTVLILLLIGLFALALNTGPMALEWAALFAPEQSVEKIVLWEVRLPRALLAMLVGATLGFAGAGLQGLFRNPLAEPGLVGVSNGAALGAVLALYFGLAAQHALLLPAMAMLGAGVAVAVVFMLAGQRSSVATLILAGVAVNAVLSSLIAMALNFAPNPYALAEIVFWLLGSVASASWIDVRLAAPLIAVGAILVFSQARFLDALTLGEQSAESLGFSIARSRLLVIVGTALMVGAAVAVSGAVGFIGLVVPHLLRPATGNMPGRLLLPSALGGAALLLAADILVQWLPTSQETKLGVVTALIGGPFFLLLIVKLRRSVP